MIVGLMPARNEAWVLAYSARAALKWLDHLVILVHASSDDTADIVDQLRGETGRVTPILEPDPDWREAEFRQRMLEAGRRRGGNIFVTLDADEVLSANQVGTVRDRLEALAPGQLQEYAWIDLWRDLDHYRSDRCRTAPLGFRDARGMCWRPASDGYQLHMRNPWPTVWNQRRITPIHGGMMHLQRVVWRRAEARQAKYKINEVLYWPARRGGVDKIEARHNKSIDETGLVLAKTPAEWWSNGVDRGLIDLDVEPWELAEVRALVAEHGRRPFAGIDLFGIA